MSLGEHEDFVRPGGAGQASVPALPAGWTPTVVYAPDGTADVVTVGTGEPDWTSEVRALGVVIPDGWTCRLVEVRHDPAAWTRQQQGEDAVTVPVTRRRWVVEPQRPARADLSELLAVIGKPRKREQRPVDGAAAYVHAIADWQLGKTAYGKGTEQTVQRVLDSLDVSLARLKALRKRAGIETVVLAGLGDVCEGVVSQGGAVALTSDLTISEQVRVYRRLLLEHVKAFAPLCQRLVVPISPGNHDETHRLLGKAPRADDSWAVDGASAVADALTLAGGYEHVEVVLPALDEGTVTVEAAGTIIGCAHGHQWRPGKGHEWWAKQSHARARIGAADLLLSGHYHHTRVEQDGQRLWVQAPTQDPGSPWFDARHGGGQSTGALTMLVRDRAWSDLAVV